jgi:hypothetical protein
MTVCLSEHMKYSCIDNSRKKFHNHKINFSTISSGKFQVSFTENSQTIYEEEKCHFETALQIEFRCTSFYFNKICFFYKLIQICSIILFELFAFEEHEKYKQILSFHFSPIRNFLLRRFWNFLLEMMSHNRARKMLE